MVMVMNFLRRSCADPRKKIFISIFIILLIFLSAFTYSFLRQDTIYAGISVDGVYVGGLTREEALGVLRSKKDIILPKDGILMITPKKIYRLPFHDINYEAEYGKALDEAYSKGREGNIFQRMLEIWRIRNRGLQIVAQMCYNKEKTAKILDSIRFETERKPRNAAISVRGGKIQLTPHQTGMIMDIEKNLEIVEESLLGRTYEDVALSVLETVPDITIQMIDKITTRLGTFSTSFSIVNENRVHNIKTACSKIDQYVILPGQVFSMDKALGDRTAGNGYKQSKVIVNNELVDGIGGGVCQVTSTFYNAVLLSGLEVVERRNHTLPLSYIEIGRDATISQGYIDFKFRNNLGYAIVVEAKTVGNQVIISIWGRVPATNNKIRIRTKIVETIEPQGIDKITDPSLKPGEIKIIREAVPGYKVEVYRETVDSSGKVIHTEKISVDRYNPQRKKMRISPITGLEEIGDES